MLRHLVKIATAAAVTAAALSATAPPAQAAGSVAYGYVRSDSVCRYSAANSICDVILTYGSTVTTTHPQNAGTVNYCSGIANGTPINSAINGGWLTGRYVAVQWGNSATFGNINCH